MKVIQTMVGENVRKLRLKAGKSLTDVERGTGIQDRYISQIEKGKVNLTLKLLGKLAAYFDVEVVELFGVQPKPAPIIEIKLDDHFAQVPLLANPGSLGSEFGIEASDMTNEPCVIPRRFLRRGGEYYSVFVADDSMAPILNNGDIVAVDVKDRNPNKLDGRLIACHPGNHDVSIKSLRVYKDKFYFKALSAKWEQQNVPLITPRKNGLILGKVVLAWKKFD